MEKYTVLFKSLDSSNNIQSIIITNEKMYPKQHFIHHYYKIECEVIWCKVHY